MNHPMTEKHRILKRRRPTRLDAAALVNGYVQNDRPRLHGFHHFLRDQMRSFLCLEENRTNDDVRKLDCTPDVIPVGNPCRNPMMKEAIKLSKTGKVLIEDGDFSTSPYCNPCSSPSDSPSTEYNNRSWRNAWDPAEEDSEQQCGSPSDPQSRS
jgi:hypothetical protein